jgi:hypothetical protein
MTAASRRPCPSRKYDALAGVIILTATSLVPQAPVAVKLRVSTSLAKLSIGCPWPPGRFPPPWTVEELDACFVVRDHNGQRLAYVYFEDESGRRIGGYPPRGRQ